MRKRKGLPFGNRFLFVALMFALVFNAAILFAGSAQLSWTPPTANTDGTPLTDLAGYKVYYGTASGKYSQSVNAGNVTTYTVPNLTDGTTYYFATTAYNTAGAESGYSNEVSKTTATQQYTLTVSKAGTGTGTVSGTGISCGTTCTGSYNSGTVVTLTATPDTGSTFAGWSGGGCSGTGQCSTTINTARTVTATFNLIPIPSYTITATAGAGGTITPSGAVTVVSGASRTFSIVPDTGYGIAGVKVDGASAGAVSTYTFSNVIAGHTLAASFATSGSSGARTGEWGNTTASNHPNTVQDTFTNLDKTNYSTSPQLNTYTWPANMPANTVLMKWDLSSIPAGSTIVSATLSLYMQGYDGTGGKSLYNVSVHKILNKNPVISQATGYNYSSTGAWTAVAGKTYNNIPLGEGDIAAPEAVKGIDKTPGYKSWSVTRMVQDWVNSRSTNYGMLLNSDPSAAADSNRYFASSKNANTGRRPKLVITYTTP